MKKSYEVHYDAGHSWLKVPKDDLVLNANLGWIIPADKLLEIKAWITEVF